MLAAARRKLACQAASTDGRALPGMHICDYVYRLKVLTASRKAFGSFRLFAFCLRVRPLNLTHAQLCEWKELCYHVDRTI